MIVFDFEMMFLKVIQQVFRQMGEPLPNEMQDGGGGYQPSANQTDQSRTFFHLSFLNDVLRLLIIFDGY